MNRSKSELFRRYASFAVVLFIIAFGTSLSIRANLGSSPISCPPYVLSCVPGGWTMGTYTICMHVFFILSQIILLRKDFQKIQLLQIVVSFIFGAYTDLTMWLTSFLQIPDTINPVLCNALRLIELFAGGSILAYGISLEVHCDVLMLAGEGFPLAISKVVKRDFGKVKMCSDTLLVCVGIVLMFIFFGGWHWEMIGPGTLISMFFVGFMVRVFSPTMGWFDRILTGEKEPSDNAEVPIGADGVAPIVIAISREYGSGGHDIGEMVAKHLGIKLYDRDIIDRAAQELGYTNESVASKEQNISTAKLWELIFTDKSIPASMNHSEDDDIFVTESRIIRSIAGKESCVIIGRMSNWVLRDRQNCLRVFISSDRQDAIAKVSEREGITAKEAEQKIESINKGRANHYFQYSGKRWTDVRQYDLMLNTSKVGIEGSASIIEALASGWQ